MSGNGSCGIILWVVSLLLRSVLEVQSQETKLFDRLLIKAARQRSSNENLDAGNIYNMTFDPPGIEEMFDDEKIWVHFELIWDTSDLNVSLSIVPKDDSIADISSNSVIPLDRMNVTGDRRSARFEVRGKFLGLTELEFYIHATDADWTEENLVYDEYEVIVLRKEKLQDEIYRYGIIIFASLIYLGFGCQIDLGWIWSILKKPIAPAIGGLCQFVLMPLIGFGVAMLLKLDDAYAFGLLTISCSPGGGGSNAYAYLLRGDLDLSITMTFISTLLSLAFMPFWIFALGRFFIDPSRVDVPYMSIIRSLLTLVIPLLIGLAIRKWLRKLSDFIVKVTKPFTIFFILYMLTYGTYVNWYIFIIMGTVPEIIPAATLVPTIGFALGYFIAYALRQKNKKSTTIGIETGYQNASIPIILLQGNFQQPEGDLGAVMPVAMAFFMQIPIYIWWAGIEIRHKWFAHEDLDDGENSFDLEQVEKEENGGFHGDGAEENKEKVESGERVQSETPTSFKNKVGVDPEIKMDTFSNNTQTND